MSENVADEDDRRLFRLRRRHIPGPGRFPEQCLECGEDVEEPVWPCNVAFLLARLDAGAKQNAALVVKMADLEIAIASALDDQIGREARDWDV